MKTPLSHIVYMFKEIHRLTGNNPELIFDIETAKPKIRDTKEPFTNQVVATCGTIINGEYYATTDFSKSTHICLHIG